MAIEAKVNENGVVSVDTSGANSTEFAGVKMANVANIVGTLCGSLIAILPQIIAMTPGNTKVTTACGIALAVATNINSLLVKLNYANGRVEVKTAGIQAAVEIAKAQNPPPPPAVTTNVMSGGTQLNTSPAADLDKKDG